VRAARLLPQQRHHRLPRLLLTAPVELQTVELSVGTGLKVDAVLHTDGVVIRKSLHNLSFLNAKSGIDRPIAALVASQDVPARAARLLPQQRHHRLLRLQLTAPAELPTVALSVGTGLKVDAVLHTDGVAIRKSSVQIAFPES
jgi:hypothetical protein